MYDTFLNKHHTNVTCYDNHHSSIVKKEFEDTKGVVRIRISKKNRQLNVQNVVRM